MSELANAPVQVRDDITEMETRSLAALAEPGGSLSGEQRVSLAEVARGLDANGRLEEFARHLYTSPATVAEARAALTPALVRGLVKRRAMSAAEAGRIGQLSKGRLNAILSAARRLRTR